MRRLNRGSLACGIACFIVGVLIYNFIPKVMANCQPHLGEPTKYFGPHLPWKCNVAQVMQLSSNILKLDATQLLLVGSLFLILIGLALIAYGAIAKVQPKKVNTKSEGQQEENQKALDILKSRLAKGEITKEEFEDCRKMLE